MKRLVVLLVILVIGFYGIWPAYSVYAIYNGIETENKMALQQKVDWPSVRTSFKQAVAPFVAQELEKQARRAGGNQGALTGALGSAVAPKIVEALVDLYMSPEGLITLARTGGQIDMQAFIADLSPSFPGLLTGGNKKSQMPGGLGQVLEDITGGLPKGDLQDLIAGKTQSGSGRKDSSQDLTALPFGVDNVKTFHFNSPSELEMSVARKATARKPDLTAVMGFSDMDWKLVKIIPHL